MENSGCSFSQLIQAIQTFQLNSKFIRERECVRLFREFLEELQQILEQLDDSHREYELPVALSTALQGIEHDLKQAEIAFAVYHGRSRFYIIAHCHVLNECVELLARSIGHRLSIVSSENKDLQKKIEHLSSAMKRVEFKVPEAEEKCYIALDEGKAYDMLVAGSIWQDLARLLGLDPESSTAALAEQIELLKLDIDQCKLDVEVQKMEAILWIFDQVSAEPQLKRMYSYKEAQERDPLEPFESFICPLTKQIMKDPVIIESEMTYERSAIERWFLTCRTRGRDVTCPISGSILTSTELRSNLILKHTIDEWFHRNATIRIQHAVNNMSAVGASLEEIEKALDGALKACEDSPSSKYELGTSGMIPLVLQLWKMKVPSGSHIRSKGLVLLLHVSIHQQDMLVDMGVLHSAVRSLSSNLVNEVENSLKLLHELSSEESISAKLGSVKGAIIHLLAISSNTSGNAALALLAEQILKNLEQVDANVQEMAEAGRLEPLFTRLCSGNEETRIYMSKCLAEYKLVDIQRDLVARKAAKILVDMLSRSLPEKEAAMGAVLNLSMLQDNVPILVKAEVLPVLYETTFSGPSFRSFSGSMSLKEAAASTLSNIVAVPGSWESVLLDDNQNILHSERSVQNILQMLSSVDTKWNSIMLKILIAMSSSPQASESVTKRIARKSGLHTLLALLEETGDAHRLHVLKLLNVVSERVTGAFLDMKWLSLLKKTLLQKKPEDSILAASILSNVTLGDTEILQVLGVDMISWCIDVIKEARSRKFGSTRMNTAMLEGVLGVLVQFTKSSDRTLVEEMLQKKLMIEFRECLQVPGQALAKQRAATGLMHLSQKGFVSKVQMESRRPWFRSFMLCAPAELQLCPLHKMRCCDGGNFCLLESDAIGLLVELLEDDHQEVQLAAVEALSTMVGDVSVDAGVQELDKVDGVRLVINWFRVAPLGSKDKGVYIVERILRIPQYGQRYSLDEALVRLLVERFRRGSPGAKRIAEAALAHTNMVSMASGSAPRPNPGRPTTVKK